MKKKFVKWLIEKIFKTEIVEIIIPISFKAKEYLPNDGETHHIAKTVEFWVIGKNIVRFNEILYRNGKRISYKSKKGSL